MAGISLTYHSPTTPGNPGFSVDLTDVSIQQGFRLGSLVGLQTEAELGAVAQSAIVLDDPTGTAGYLSDAIVGLKQISVNEGRAPSGNRRIGEFYIADRRYYRGNSGTSPSLRTGSARLIDITLSDINSFLSFRILRTGTANGSNTTFNRPAETDVERVTALLAIPFLSDTLFDGLVSTANPVNMDANDYTGQTPADVLNDCAQQSGKNYFVFYDEAGTYTPAAGDYGLFYDANSSSAYPSYDPAFQVSNVLTDISAGGAGPIWYPLIDAQLVRDPSRVVSGVYFANGSNSVYVEQPTTSYAYGWRDAVGNTQNLKTVAQITARGQRYVGENSTEDDRLTFTLKLPAAHVNDWKEGQWAQVKFIHLPNYGAYTTVRCLSRTVAQDEETDQFYNVKYECGTSIVASSPSGAVATAIRGVSFSGIPALPRPTTPGNVLILGLAGAGNTTKFPIDVRMTDDPPTSGSPPVPPYSGHAGWTVIATATTDESGCITGGPCGGPYGGPFNGAAGSCTNGLIAAWAWRYVQPGEITTHPVAVSTEILDSSCVGVLFELPTTTPPTGAFVASDGAAMTTGSSGPTSATNTLASLSGNVVVLQYWATAPGHPANLQPSFRSSNGTEVLAGLASTNEGPIPTANQDYYLQVYQLPAGGAGSATIHVGSTSPSVNYNQVNHCEVAIELPAGVVLPNIPYPANQTS